MGWDATLGDTLGPIDVGTLERSDPSGRTGWGIAARPWLWPTQIRILVVIDGRITTGSEDYEFGLGLVLDTLRDSWFAWWVRFLVEVKGRDDPERFRFTDPDFDVNLFHQVWFFGDWPGLEANPPTAGDDLIDLPAFAPLDDDELRIVAEWMDRGGGVFATGDHSLLGASMCRRIPRVRTMRRWTRAQGVPSFSGLDRIETLVPAAEAGALDWEGDSTPQRIFPVLRPGPSPFALDASPHPILCGKYAIIDRFPDHMHEGAVFDDHEVVLDAPLDIAGYDGPEYPRLEPRVVAARAAIGGSINTPVDAGVRPRPQVIAYGMMSRLSAPLRFPMISVYDGEPVGLGRVVVESTWHHWFSMNLVGLRDRAPVVYSGMQEYFRNVAVWLATPAQRRWMLIAATWGVLAGSHPGAFDRSMGIWDVGTRVVDVLARTMPQCTMRDLIATTAELPQVAGAALPEASEPAPELEHRVRVSELSARAVDTVIVGAMATEMIELAHHLFNERARGRDTALDQDAVRRLGESGAALGRQVLAEAVAEASERYGRLADLLAQPRDEASSRD
jgi:hypothetical protein